MIISEIIKLLTINKSDSQIIGSFSNNKLKFFSDVDLQENVLHISPKTFISKIKEIVRKVELHPEIYFVDFKLGKFRDSSVHFTQEEILKDKKVIENKKDPLTMEQLILSEKSIIKLDIVAFIKSQHSFLDFSINYYFMRGNINTQPVFNIELGIIFRSDFLKKVEEGDYIKGIKRLYKLAEVREEKRIQRQIENFLNSGVGRIAELKDTLTTLRNTVALDEFDSWREYTLEIQFLESIFFKHGIANIVKKLLSIKRIKNKSVIEDTLDEIIKELDDYIQPRSQQFIKTIRGLPDLMESK